MPHERPVADHSSKTSPSFDPGAHGLDAETVMDPIHGVLPDETVIEGVEVFRRAYAAPASSALESESLGSGP